MPPAGLFVNVTSVSDDVDAPVVTVTERLARLSDSLRSDGRTVTDATSVAGSDCASVIVAVEPDSEIGPEQRPPLIGPTLNAEPPDGATV